MEVSLIRFYMTSIRGDVKIHLLQPPYSAAGCSQLIYEKLYITVRCCSILAAASCYTFLRLPLVWYREYVCRLLVVFIKGTVHVQCSE